MGYTTDFKGSFTLDKPLTADQKEYLNMFADTRRMTRDPCKLKVMKDTRMGNTRCFELMDALNLPIGGNGEYYCGTGHAGQDGGHFNSTTDNSVVEYNFAPGERSGGQPGLWCQWNPSEDGTEIAWDGSEKFYHYTEWLEYLIDVFLKPWGYKVNGMVEWVGEDSSDIGVIEVVDNVVETHEGKTIAHLEDNRKHEKMTESAIAASEAFKASKSLAADERDSPVDVAEDVATDILLDLIKLRNEIANSKKGTAVACKKLDALIAKYEA